MDALYQLADREWCKINAQYAHLDSDQFLMLYDLWIEAFVAGHRAGCAGE